MICRQYALICPVQQQLVRTLLQTERQAVLSGLRSPLPATRPRQADTARRSWVWYDFLDGQGAIRRSQAPQRSIPPVGARNLSSNAIHPRSPHDRGRAARGPTVVVAESRAGVAAGERAAFAHNVEAA